MRARDAHHRPGATHNRSQRRAYHLHRYGWSGRVAMRILEQSERLSPNVYRIPAALMLELKHSTEAFLVYHNDEDGEAWK